MSRAIDNLNEICTECYNGVFRKGADPRYVQCDNRKCENLHERYESYVRDKNMDILSLLKDYEMNNSVNDLDTIKWLVQTTLLYVGRMEDGHDRCLLWKMARQLDEDYKLGIVHPDYK